VPPEQDDDADGLPDWWEIARGLDPGDDGSAPGSPGNGPEGDPDGDGWDNAFEFLVGLDPFVADSGSQPPLIVTVNPDGSVALTFPTIPDRRYAVWWSDDLLVWSAVGPVLDTGAEVFASTAQIVDDGPPATPVSPAEVPERFYRLEVSLPLP
jgi:hypothetical protein